MLWTGVRGRLPDDFHSALGGHPSLWPTRRGVGGGQGEACTVALGLWERGKRGSHACESERSLDEQRLSMVLELYCRKAGRKKVERGREAGHDHVGGEKREKEG